MSLRWHLKRAVREIVSAVEWRVEKSMDDASKLLNAKIFNSGVSMQALLTRQQHRVLVLGMAGAGRTALLQHLCQPTFNGEFGGSSAERSNNGGSEPTPGFTTHHLTSFPGLGAVTFLDVAADNRTQSLLGRFGDASALIYVVNSASNDAQLADAASEILRIRSVLQQLPLLVLASHQDEPRARSIAVLHEALGLPNLSNFYPAVTWYLQGCDAVTSAGYDGIINGLRKLRSSLRLVQQ